MLLREPEAAAAPSRRGRWPVALALVVLALATAGWFVWDALRSDTGRSHERDRAATSTASLKRRTLVERESVEGTLGYAGARTIANRLGPAGTVTWLAPSGSVLRPGAVLYRVDDQPVVLMDGAVPAYRQMARGIARGEDVRQLESNLVALGFGAGITVDDRFTEATATAVKRWQRSLGLKRTGAVELGRVVFLSGPRRVGERKAAVGAALAPGAEVLTTTSTRRIVEVELDVAKQSLVRRGAGVRVTLPDGSEVAGRIVSVGRAARAKDGGGEGGDAAGDAAGDEGSGDEELVIDMSVALRSTRGVGRLDRAPVTVDIARQVERDVLAAPVTALLARQGGGYALEIVDRAGRRRQVAVRTGFFADGYVEVEGRGIRAGTKVVVPE